MATSCLETCDDVLTEVLRVAIRDAITGGRSTYQITRDADLLIVGQLGDFLRGESGFMLRTAATLAAVLGMRLVSGPGGEELPLDLSEALKHAFAASGMLRNHMAKATGVHFGIVSKFFSGECDISLRNAGKFAAGLGLRLVGGGNPRTLAAKAIQPEPPGPISEALRHGVKASGKTARELAALSGLQYQPIIAFMAGEIDLGLESANKLAVPLRLRLVREHGPDDLPDDFTDAIKVAIETSPFTPREIARLARLYYGTLTGFARGDYGMRLAIADRLATAMGLVLKAGVRIVAVAPRNPKAAQPARSTPDEVRSVIRAAIVSSGKSDRDIGRRAGVSPTTVRRARAGTDNLDHGTSIKLAGALELNLEPAAIMPPPSPTAVASRLCPIELRGEGFPILVYGVQVPRLTGIAYALVRFAVERFHQGGVCAGSELASQTTSNATNPIKSLTLKLKQSDFLPLARVLIWDGKRGGSLRIIDPGPIG